MFAALLLPQVRTGYMPRHSDCVIEQASLPARSNRARAPDVYSLGDWKLSGNAATSTLMHDESGYKFDLSLIAYESGFVRLRVTEPGKRRFEVPDVLLDDLPKLEVVWTIRKRDENTVELTSAVGTTIVATSRPFALELVRGSSRIDSPCILNGFVRFVVTQF